MKKRLIGLTFIASLALVACERFGGNQHLVQTKADREAMIALAEKRANMSSMVDLASLNRKAAQGASAAEIEAVQFLYAYMPLCDLGVLTQSFVEQQAEVALEARSAMKWGSKVPNDLFLYYVLPFRSADEHVDEARATLYNELKAIVQGKSMADAAKEVGFWCREQASPKATLSNRISGPLTVMRAAAGHPGELAALATAALRAVCIPARVVNAGETAWPEFWADGQWFAMDVANPTAVGIAPAEHQTAAGAHTVVPGVYRGAEEWLSNSPYHTDLDLQKERAAAAPLKIKVENANGEGVANALLEVLRLQGSELVPIARSTTDSHGQVELPAMSASGLMLWASKDSQYALVDFDGASGSAIRLQSASELPQGSLGALSVHEAHRGAGEAAQRTQQCNALSAQREQAFVAPEYASQLAKDKGISAASVNRALTLSRGNWEEIRNFIANLDGNGLTVGMALLDGLDERDLQFASADLLRSHLNASDIFPSLVTAKQFPIFDRYILAPRIGREPLEKWRDQIHEHFSFDEAGFFRNNPENIVQWLLEHINIDNQANYVAVPMTPSAVLRLGVADVLSRNILFVAICRSFGVPARLTTVSQTPQYMTRSGWHTPMGLVAGHPSSVGMATLGLSGNTAELQFSLSLLRNGSFEPLNIGSVSLPAQFDVEAGLYRLITRTASGECTVRHFEVLSGSAINLQI